MGDRVQPIGVSRIAGDEHQFAIVNALRIPMEIIGDFRRFAVFVNAEQAEVEIEPRILEIIRIAAEKGDLLLGRKDEPDIGIAFVAIELVDAAAIKRDHVAAEAGGVVRFFLDRVDHGPAGFISGGRVHLRLDGRLDAGGHVLGGFEHVEFAIDDTEFLGSRSGMKAVVHIVVLGRAQFLQCPGPDVMIGEHQPVGGDERPAAAVVESHGGKLQMLEPLGRRLEAVFLFEDFRGRTGKQPHSFIGGGEIGEHDERQQTEDRGEQEHAAPATEAMS